jgi:acyl carrier protein
MTEDLATKLETRVTEALITFGAEPDAINRDAGFGDLDVDSLDLVELAQIVEEEFGVELTVEDAQELTTIGDALDLILARAT